MKVNDLYNDKLDISNKIRKQIELGESSINSLKPTLSTDSMQKIFDNWVNETESILKEFTTKDKLDREFISKVEISTNTISKIETKKLLIKGLDAGVKFLKELLQDINNENLQLKSNTYLKSFYPFTFLYRNEIEIWSKFKKDYCNLKPL